MQEVGELEFQKISPHLYIRGYKAAMCGFTNTNIFDK